MKRGLLALLLLSASGLCSAHQDRIITRAPDGSLPDLPPVYQPATLTLKFSAVGGEQRLTALRLQLGPKASVQIPTCVLGLIRSNSASQAVLSASWYHDESVLPPYLSARFVDPEAGAPSFTLLFNLRMARLMEMSVNIAEQSLALDLHARCAADELKDVLTEP